MSKLVALKIDVSKIDKDRLYQGTKGVYLDAVVWLNDDADKYGNHGMITQSVSKEERDSGVKGEILGNAKILMVKDDRPSTGQVTGQARNQPDQSGYDDGEQSDLPW